MCDRTICLLRLLNVWVDDMKLSLGRQKLSCPMQHYISLYDGCFAFLLFCENCLTTLLFAQDHLQSLVDLQKLVDSVIDSTAHPHAIDGQKLSRPLQSGDGDADMHKGTANQPPAAHFASNSVDIVQLLQVGCLGVD